MVERKEYPLEVTVNGRRLTRVVIDQHYREGHEDMNDEIILNLVGQLDGGYFPIDEEKDGFQYFVVEPVLYESKPYRLILLLCLFDNILGVVNAFRVRRK